MITHCQPLLLHVCIAMLVSSAELSGGGLFHHGAIASLNDTRFVANTAGEGPAVMNEGNMGSMSNVYFEGNMVYCPEGAYGYNRESNTDEVLFPCDGVPPMGHAFTSQSSR